MIYSLRGTLLEKTVSEAVIECGGVGYLASISATAAGALPAVGSEATLYTCLHVSENDMGLFGFATLEDRAMFQLLTGVSGVGPKVALAILSALSPGQVALAVSAGDYKSLTVANGVGPKLAQRLVLELKDKMAAYAEPGGVSLEEVQQTAAPGQGNTAAKAVAALVSLGYSQMEAAQAVAAVDPGLPLAEVIRLALKSVGGK
ncbi:Holliday junction branch migration protein RuvA [Ruminococcaceae bacterium OttesenSCG-928-I18]|nr:Holliday junction branch migration protein RuvA [Ruminococcaceae bacterium OttesenSCG-928-I18]